MRGVLIADGMPHNGAQTETDPRRRQKTNHATRRRVVRSEGLLHD